MELINKKHNIYKNNDIYLIIYRKKKYYVNFNEKTLEGDTLIVYNNNFELCQNTNILENIYNKFKETFNLNEN